MFALRGRGATLHPKVVVTGVGDIWRARAYNGVWGQSPQRGPGAEPLVRGQGGLAPVKLKGFGKTTSKSVHKFSTFTTVCEKFQIAREKVVVACHHRHIQSCAYAAWMLTVLQDSHCHTDL